MIPPKNEDLHGNVPDHSDVALVMIDVINDLEFPGGDRLFEQALPMAKRLAKLKRRAKAAGVPVIYANDNFGRWRSDLNALISHGLEDGVRGAPIVKLLRPDEDDYFVLKPKHSAFFSTTMDTLLRYLQVKTLILTGIAGDICVLYTANDAFMRDFLLVVPSDCCVSQDPRENRHALRQMEFALDADVMPSAKLDFDALKERVRRLA